MLKSGDRIALVGCSNARKASFEPTLRTLEAELTRLGLDPVRSRYLFEADGGSARGRAQALTEFYRDDAVRAIFDISGGDAANGILPYLDYSLIARSGKLLWGYSDLTCVLNAIYARTGRPSVLWQARHLANEQGRVRLADFENTTLRGRDDLFSLRCRFVQGSAMRGTVVGGNIRCLLKLAGTPFMPDLTGKILLLESLHGNAARINACLCQLMQMGAFERAAGVLLGTFTQLEEEAGEDAAAGLLLDHAPSALPVALTRDVGHAPDAKAVMIGAELAL